MPNLIVPVGIPGSGKSSLAKTLKHAKTVSSDSIRESLFGDEAHQYTEDFIQKKLDLGEISFDGMTEVEIEKKKNELGHIAVFEEMDRQVEEALKNGNDVVYDATNTSRWGREHLLHRFEGLYDKAYACYFQIPLRKALKRNEKRSRSVPKDVIRRMHRQLEKPRLDEGFDSIQIIKV